MKNTKNKKYRGLSVVLTLVTATLFTACNDMFDNVKQFADSEIIYADRLDGILRTQIGYERIEIDLMKAGRIPASRINMGKAKKTVIECADFTEPNHRRVIDSICSWVNITGLTQLKTYQFTIYTEDEHGNRSLPLKAEGRPYTVENLNALELVSPSVVESTSAALLEWQEPLTTKVYNFFRYAYEYTDKDGAVHTGGEDGDLLSFYVENVSKGQDVNIRMTCRIVPKLMDDEGIYAPILDTIDWHPTVVLNISPNAVSAIFLKTPAQGTRVDANDPNVFPVAFSWTKVPEVNSYVLKVSMDPSFPNNNETVLVPVGDNAEYVLEKETGISIIKSFRTGTATLYWTIASADQNTYVRTQSRQLVATRSQPAVVGRWLFEDASNIGKATTGQDLQLVGSSFLSVAGPAANKKAVRVGRGSYFKCLHGIINALGETKVNEYTIMFYVKYPETVPHALFQTSLANNDGADYFINANGYIGIANTGYSNDMNIGPEQWHRVILSATMGKAYVTYLDGDPIYSGNTTAASVDSRFSLDPEGVLFFADNSAEDNEIDVAEIVVWDAGFEDSELQKYFGMKRLDRSSWQIPYYTDYNGSSYAPNILLTGTSMWHSQYQPTNYPPPHWIVVDMREPKNIRRINLYRRLGQFGDTKTVQLLTGNSPDPAAAWTQIAQGEWATQHTDQSGMVLTFDFSGVTSRYLKIYFPDVFPARNVVNLRELIVYGE